MRFAHGLDELERTTALATSVASLEVALTALGIPKVSKQGFLNRFETSSLISRVKDAPTIAEIKAAVEARNRAVHGQPVPDPKQCVAHAKALFKTWCGLRRLYVTRETAGRLAMEFLASGAVTHVFLFGSLAVRGRKDPKDIDLLLYDDGELSSISRRYRGTVENWFLDEIFSDHSAVEAALRLGWLDYLVIHGKRFGHDKQYTQSVVRQQADSLFFVNIADAILKYDISKRKWTVDRPKIFLRLASIKEQLAIENIVSA
jgi:predicted nucleotidyltransferase